MIQERQSVLIKYLKNIINSNEWKVKAEYSTNQNDEKVVVVQETTGNRIVMFGNINPLFNYYNIEIFGLSIQECKELANTFSYLIGKNEQITFDNKIWQIMFKQVSNPQAVAYEDIRRVGYTMILQCIINPIYEIEGEN